MIDFTTTCIDVPVARCAFRGSARATSGVQEVQIVELCLDNWLKKAS